MLLVDDKYCVYVPEKSEMQGLKIIWYLKCHADLISVFSIMLCRGVEQLVARWAHNPKVVGSSPSPATKYGGIAQLARAFGSYPKRRRFKSYSRYQLS